MYPCEVCGMSARYGVKGKRKPVRCGSHRCDTDIKLIRSNATLCSMHDCRKAVTKGQMYCKPHQLDRMNHHQLDSMKRQISSMYNEINLLYKQLHASSSSSSSASPSSHVVRITVGSPSTPPPVQASTVAEPWLDSFEIEMSLFD